MWPTWRAPQADDPVSLHGRWEVREKYGLQFAVERIEPPVELDATGLVNYLANHPEIRGIGPEPRRSPPDWIANEGTRLLQPVNQEFGPVHVILDENIYLRAPGRSLLISSVKWVKSDFWRVRSQNFAMFSGMVFTTAAGTGSEESLAPDGTPGIRYTTLLAPARISYKVTPSE